MVPSKGNGGLSMLTLYKNIRKRRLQLGYTQEELAKKVGYSGKSMIARVEKGDVDLTQSKIITFADALNTTPAALMGWDDESVPLPHDKSYYLDPEAAKVAQEIFDDPELHALVDAARDVTPEALRQAANILRLFKDQLQKDEPK